MVVVIFKRKHFFFHISIDSCDHVAASEGKKYLFSCLFSKVAIDERVDFILSVWPVSIKERIRIIIFYCKSTVQVMCSMYTTTFLASPSLAKDVLAVSNLRAGSHIVLVEECSGSKEQEQMKK